MSENETLIATIVLLLIPIGLFVFFGIFFWRRLFRGGGSRVSHTQEAKADLEARRARALESTARITLSQPISMGEIIDQHGFGQYRDVRLTLEVSRPRAEGDEESYEVTVMWDVQLLALPSVAPGATVDVLIDRDDEGRVYPNVPWARTSV